MSDTWPGAVPPHLLALRQGVTPRPRRSPVLHWAAFVLSVVSLGLLVAWLVTGRGPVPLAWYWADVALGALFFFEFFSRSGFRWNPVGYTATRFFDFIAIVPVLALVGRELPGQEAWLWIIFSARVARTLDRILGDGFVHRNFMALIEGFEEEVTDRVLLHIMDRIQTDLERGHFGQGIAEALEKNKPAVLERIGAEHPFEGFKGGFAHLIGAALEVFLRRTEQHVYEATVNILNSPEVDRTIRDAVNSVFDTMRAEIVAKKWHQRFGLGESDTQLWETGQKPPEPGESGKPPPESPQT
jgi:hypothetical protein